MPSSCRTSWPGDRDVGGRGAGQVGGAQRRRVRLGRPREIGAADVGPPAERDGLGGEQREVAELAVGVGVHRARRRPGRRAAGRARRALRVQRRDRGEVPARAVAADRHAGRVEAELRGAVAGRPRDREVGVLDRRGIAVLGREAVVDAHARSRPPRCTASGRRGRSRRGRRCTSRRRAARRALRRARPPSASTRGPRSAAAPSGRAITTSSTRATGSSAPPSADAPSGRSRRASARNSSGVAASNSAAASTISASCGWSGGTAQAPASAPDDAADGGLDARGDRLAGEADLGVQERGLAVRDVAVGQPDAQDPRHVRPPLVRQRLPDGGAEAAREHALLDRHEQLVLGGELREQAGVERLGEARVGDGDLDAALGQQVGRLERPSARRCRSRRSRPCPRPRAGSRRSRSRIGAIARGSGTPTPSPRG